MSIKHCFTLIVQVYPKIIQIKNIFSIGNKHMLFTPLLKLDFENMLYLVSSIQ